MSTLEYLRQWSLQAAILIIRCIFSPGNAGDFYCVTDFNFVPSKALQFSIPHTFVRPRFICKIQAELTLQFQARC